MNLNNLYFEIYHCFSSLQFYLRQTGFLEIMCVIHDYKWGYLLDILSFLNLHPN